MRMRMTSVVVLLAIAGVLGCDQSVAPADRRDLHEGTPLVDANGTVVWVAIEGGFWAIRGDDQVLYDPHPTVPREFQQHGLRVRFAARQRPDLGCFHAVGPIVTVTEIRRR